MEGYIRQLLSKFDQVNIISDSESTHKEPQLEVCMVRDGVSGAMVG